ncbi:MAG: amino acid-binding protein [Tepidisphaeraceae bacterium]
MALSVTKSDVWAGEMMDRPGELNRVLDALARGGVKLECCIARRSPDKPGMGTVFVTPVKGKKAQEAARMCGLSPGANLATLRLEGPDKPGAGAMLSRAVADAGINVRGCSAAVIGSKYVAYVGFDNAGDADRAMKAIKSAAKAKKK